MSRIEIDFTPAEGAILRLVGLVERRGFEVVGVDVPDMRAAVARMAIEVSPRDANRRIETLHAQIRRVHGVREVRSAAAPAQPRAPRLEAAS